ncbi:MAG: hypothetical protein AB7K71_19030 [Polyangiaceae bacterium]
MPKRRATPSGFSVHWLAWWRFQQRDWYAAPEPLAALVEAVQRSVYWPHMNRMGIGFKKGGEIPPKPALLQAMRSKSPGVFSFARGDADAPTWGDATQCLVRMDVMRSYFSLQCMLRENALAAAGAACLDSGIELVLELRRAWADIAYLQYAESFPAAKTGLEYTRPHPNLMSNSRSLCALVHIVDPDVVVGEDEAWRQAENVRLATAKLPKSISRVQRDGATIIRTVSDPTELTKLRRAAATHERWIVPLIETLPADE